MGKLSAEQISQAVAAAAAASNAGDAGACAGVIKSASDCVDRDTIINSAMAVALDKGALQMIAADKQARLGSCDGSGSLCVMPGYAVGATVGIGVGSLLLGVLATWLVMRKR